MLAGLQVLREWNRQQVLPVDSQWGGVTVEQLFSCASKQPPEQVTSTSVVRGCKALAWLRDAADMLLQSSNLLCQPPMSVELDWQAMAFEPGMLAAHTLQDLAARLGPEGTSDAQG